MSWENRPIGDDDTITLEVYICPVCEEADRFKVARIDGEPWFCCIACGGLTCPDCGVKIQEHEPPPSDECPDREGKELH